MCDALPSPGLFAFWDWTHPSLPLPQSRSAKKGGGDIGIAPGNRLLATDHGLTGSTQAWAYRSPDKVSLDHRLKFAINCEFT